MIRDADHLFMCMSSLEKYLLRYSAYFRIGLFGFLILSFMSCLYILEIKPLLVPSFANIFSHSVDCLSRFFDDGHSDWCEVIPHCGFDLHFSND